MWHAAHMQPPSSACCARRAAVRLCVLCGASPGCAPWRPLGGGAGCWPPACTAAARPWAHSKWSPRSACAHSTAAPPTPPPRPRSRGTHHTPGQPACTWCQTAASCGPCSGCTRASSCGAARGRCGFGACRPACARGQTQGRRVHMGARVCVWIPLYERVRVHVRACAWCLQAHMA